jgi:hypothetical protein
LAALHASTLSMMSGRSIACKNGTARPARLARAVYFDLRSRVRHGLQMLLENQRRILVHNPAELFGF